MPRITMAASNMDLRILISWYVHVTDGEAGKSRIAGFLACPGAGGAINCRIWRSRREPRWAFSGSVESGSTAYRLGGAVGLSASGPLRDILPSRTNSFDRERGTKGGPGDMWLWREYYWAGRGKVQATGRRFNTPTVEVLYSLAFYAVVGIIIYFISTLSSQQRADQEDGPNGLSSRHNDYRADQARWW